MGTDGSAQMSKSRGNTIDLRDSAETVPIKVRGMYAGPPRGAREPGTVAENPVFSYLDAFEALQPGTQWGRAIAGNHGDGARRPSISTTSRSADAASGPAPVA
jgi:tryptophanyl-tRNA synthetase